jgi:hypothetical protein
MAVESSTFPVYDGSRVGHGLQANLWKKPQNDPFSVTTLISLLWKADSDKFEESSFPQSIVEFCMPPLLALKTSRQICGNSSFVCCGHEMCTRITTDRSQNPRMERKRNSHIASQKKD